MAGTSQILSNLNEILMPEIARYLNGTVIVSGGGKFTARFSNNQNAQKAREEIIKEISTTLPMLEFQVSPVFEAENFNQAKQSSEKDGNVQPGILEYLNDLKRTYRGYGVTFNPHLRLCDECAEYPATETHPADRTSKICRFCKNAHMRARINHSKLKDKKYQLTTLEQVYLKFFESLEKELENLSIPMNFQDLFNSDEERQRLAIWVSDLNNMNTKVPIWLSQDEDDVLNTFKMVTEVNIKIISSALADTFTSDKLIQKDKRTFIPFRLIVAGGDDLCIVMPATYILEFARNLNIAIHRKIGELSEDHPLHPEWLKSRAKDKDPGPYCYGGAFVVTDIHTPFKKIHTIAEELMKEAKEKTQRQANSVNWRVMSTEEHSSTDSLLCFDRPLLYGDFNSYYELCTKFRDLSASKIYQLSEILIEFFSTGKEVERQLLRIPETWRRDSAMHRLMKEESFRNGEGRIIPEKLATFLELLTLYREG
jgi:CRISPR/Cas system-associated protein Cas10 (large subunit of type III CRISPR-Cas system)